MAAEREEQQGRTAVVQEWEWSIVEQQQQTTMVREQQAPLPPGRSQLTLEGGEQWACCLLAQAGPSLTRALVYVVEEERRTGSGGRRLP